MNKYKQLSMAISIAVEAHEGQYDRGGKPYILHPLHLMNQLMFDAELATIAVLHDVVEDSDWTLSKLEDVGFSYRVLSALGYLTHEAGISYENYIRGVANNHDAIRVKRKDLEHNSDITRLKGIKGKDLKRMEKYHKAFILLGEAKRKFQ
jgi:(p)ppGpp synthase/HD superfamily hydrolase